MIARAWGPAARMQDVVMRLALAAILAAALFFALAMVFGGLHTSTDSTATSIELARENSLNRSAFHLQT